MASITFGQNKINSSNPYCVLTVNDGSPNSGSNTSVVSFSLVLKRPYNISSSASKTWSVNIDGQTFSGSGSIGGSGDKTLLTGSKTITHNGDGSRSIGFSATANLSITWSGKNLGTISGSGSMSLTKIARYLTGMSVWISSKTETSVTWSWKANEDVSSVSYKLSTSSNWIYPGGTGKSGSFTVSNFGAGSVQNINISLQRNDSKLWSYSGDKECNTYNWPYCSSAQSFNIESKGTTTYYNPLNRTMTVTVYGDDGSIIWGPSSISGTSYTGYDSKEAGSTVDRMYKSIPEKKKGHFKVKVEYAGHVNIRDADDYYIVDESIAGPTITNTGITDRNATVTAATGSQDIIVKGKSWARTYGTVKSRNYATLKSWTHGYDGVTRSGVFGSNVTSQELSQDWTSANADNFTITVKDSRGITTTYIHKITFTTYTLPKMSLTAIRGVFDPVYKTWKDAETSGKWARIIFDAAIDSRLKIDGTRSTVSVNGVTTKYSNFNDLYLGNGNLNVNIGYAVEAVLYDNLGQMIKAAVSLPSGKFIMEVIEESGICFGGMAEKGKFKVTGLKMDTPYDELFRAFYDVLKNNVAFRDSMDVNLNKKLEEMMNE